jgi:UDP-4-amino-4,6-dideoxy-N-acetyl-beta-L-altrosamine N-acetyltransferase
MPEFIQGETCLRSMTAEDLELVLAWRNHQDVRRFMLTQHEITLAEHTRWFEQASNEQGRHLRIFEFGGKPLGFVHFSGSKKGGTANWGFYVAPYAPKGTGRRLGMVGLGFAFKAIGLHKVCGRALDFNDASIRFHRLLGFKQEGVLREQHRIGERYHDLICFGLLQREWLEYHEEENG